MQTRANGWTDNLTAISHRIWKAATVPPMRKLTISTSRTFWKIWTTTYIQEEGPVKILQLSVDLSIFEVFRAFANQESCRIFPESAPQINPQGFMFIEVFWKTDWGSVLHRPTSKICEHEPLDLSGSDILRIIKDNLEPKALEPGWYQFQWACETTCLRSEQSVPYFSWPALLWKGLCKYRQSGAGLPLVWQFSPNKWHRQKRGYICTNYIFEHETNLQCAYINKRQNRTWFICICTTLLQCILNLTAILFMRICARCSIAFYGKFGTFI